MALALENSKTTSGKESKSAALLNKYLSTAVKLTHGETIIGAHKATSELVNRSGWEEIKREDVEAKRAEVKAELKNYSLKDKASYFANIKAGEHGRETLIKLGVLATAASVAHAVSPEAGIAVGMAAAAYAGAKFAAGAYGEPTTPKQLFSTADYADLKHTQMALRKLSHKLMKKENDDMIRAAMIRGVVYPIGR